MPPPPHQLKQDYTVGWICALSLEMAAAIAMLDEDHGKPPKQLSYDQNNYHLGRIGEHNVVIACLPAGVYGTTSAATVAAQMLCSFESIRIRLVVGIGGGVPSKGNDIRLGDVVVSKPRNTLGGVVQYDFGKIVGEGRFICTGSSNKPPQVLLTAVASLEARHMMEGSKIYKFLSDMVVKYPQMEQKFSYQGAQHDRLYEAEYDHEGDGNTCETCYASKLIDRPVRSRDASVIHYGLVASGNQVIKHGVTRDLLREELDVLCFEMEAAGLMDNFPCLVIRGICDYADSHKNKRWQEYAAATAAAYSKELLCIIATNELAREPTAAEATGLGNAFGLGQSLQQRGPYDTASMPSSAFTFTSTLWAKDDVQLASLIPDKRYPNQDALTEILVEEGTDFSVCLDRNFNERIRMGSDSFFTATITRLLSMSWESETSNCFQLSADECRIYLLRQPKALFRQLCALEKVKRWLQEGYVDNQDTYFVTGYRTLLNAKLVRQDSSKFSVQRFVPAEAGGEGNFDMLGERIYAICYRKVRFKFFKGVDSAFLNSSNRWKSFAEARGNAPAEGEIVEADIEDVDDRGDGTLETFATEDGEEAFVGLPSEEEDD